MVTKFFSLLSQIPKYCQVVLSKSWRRPSVIWRHLWVIVHKQPRMDADYSGTEPQSSDIQRSHSYDLVSKRSAGGHVLSKCTTERQSPPDKQCLSWLFPGGEYLFVVHLLRTWPPYTYLLILFIFSLPYTQMGENNKINTRNMDKQ